MSSSRHLQLPHDEPCSFCSYLEGGRPYTILWRDDLIATLVTREQRGDPHLLVVPVRHVPTILDLLSDEAAALMDGVIDAARLIDSAAGRPGIAVWQSNGAPATQNIPHVHFHVAGTREGGGTSWGPVPELSVHETNLIANGLRESAAWRNSRGCRTPGHVP